mgnify:CR=1 FL=1
MLRKVTALKNMSKRIRHIMPYVKKIIAHNV